MRILVGYGSQRTQMEFKDCVPDGVQRMNPYRMESQISYV